MTLFNVVFTATTPLVVGWFDRDLDKTYGERFPLLYRDGARAGRRARGVGSGPRRLAPRLVQPGGPVLRFLVSTPPRARALPPPGQRNLYFNLRAISGWLSIAVLHAAVILVAVMLGAHPTNVCSPRVPAQDGRRHRQPRRQTLCQGPLRVSPCTGLTSRACPAAIPLPPPPHTAVRPLQRPHAVPGAERHPDVHHCDHHRARPAGHRAGPVDLDAPRRDVGLHRCARPGGGGAGQAWRGLGRLAWPLCKGLQPACQPWAGPTPPQCCSLLVDPVPAPPSSPS
jgi:hypothetical protein